MGLRSSDLVRVVSIENLPGYLIYIIQKYTKKHKRDEFHVEDLIHTDPDDPITVVDVGQDF